jgi:hypothetical protein
MYNHRGGNSANKIHETKKLPSICVVGGCSNVTDTEKGISLHFIPILETRCTERKGDGLTLCNLNEQYEIQALP